MASDLFNPVYDSKVTQKGFETVDNHFKELFKHRVLEEQQELENKIRAELWHHNIPVEEVTKRCRAVYRYDERENIWIMYFYIDGKSIFSQEINYKY